MKFDIKFLALFILIACLFTIGNCFRKSKFRTSMMDEPINVFLNRGFSYLNLDKDIFKDVEKQLGKKNIFSHDLDIGKNYYGDFYVSDMNFHLALNRNISNFDTEEMRKTMQVTVNGDYRVTVGSDVQKYADGHILRKVARTHLYTDTIGRLSLNNNPNKNFPNLDKSILEEAYKHFYESPNNAHPEHTIADLINDRNVIAGAISFFSDYGTHYVNDAIYGYRYGFNQEFKNADSILKDKDGKNPVHDLTKMSFVEEDVKIDVKPTEEPVKDKDVPPSKSPEEKEDKSKIPTPQTAGANTKPDLNHFSIGECSIDKHFMKPETCNPKNPRLVRFEVTPIYYLFNPLMQTKKDFSAKGEAIDKPKMAKLHQNMELLYQEIQLALDPTLLVVTNIESLKLSKEEAAKNECLKIPIKALEKIFKGYTQTQKKYLYKEDVFINGKHLPVTTIHNYQKLRQHYHIITSGDTGMYWCLTRKHNITPEELKNGKWKENKYLTDIKVIIDHDAKPFTSAGWECKEAWEFTDPKTKNINRWHFCSKYTDNFMHANIVNDIKIFEFDPKMHKCAGKHLTTYLDGKNYHCDCDLNLKIISDTKKQGDTYFCKSYKLELFHKHELANKPEFTANKSNQ